MSQYRVRSWQDRPEGEWKAQGQVSVPVDYGSPYLKWTMCGSVYSGPTREEAEGHVVKTLMRHAEDVRTYEVNRQHRVTTEKITDVEF
jgi:hypothetical protein